MAPDRKWEDLPSDLLHSIAQRLTTTDYFRFEAVCSWWRSSSSPRDPVPLPSEMPFLLLPGDDDDDDHCCTLVRFSDPDRRPCRIGPVAEMRGKWLVGSQNGWIGLIDEHSEVTFLNPLTRAQIHLPSVTTVAKVTPIFDENGALSAYFRDIKRFNIPSYNSLNSFRGGSFKKIVLSSTPTIGNAYSAIRKPAFAAEGSGEWQLVDDTPVVAYDIIYHDGKFLIVAYDGGLWALDPKDCSSPPRMTMVAQGWDNLDEKYLVESSGDLLEVWKQSDGSADNPDIVVRVVKFVANRGEWVPLRSLGERSPFLGLSYSISLSSGEVHEMKPNCIYFSQILWGWVNEDNPVSKIDKLETRELFVFNLEDGSLDHYHPPELRLNWPPPLLVCP